MNWSFPPFPSRLQEKFPRSLGFIEAPGTLSEKGFDLLQGLLTLNPATRFTAAEALAHPWCASGHGRFLLPGICPALPMIRQRIVGSSLHLISHNKQLHCHSACTLRLFWCTAYLLSGFVAAELGVDNMSQACSPGPSKVVGAVQVQ